MRPKVILFNPQNEYYSMPLAVLSIASAIDTKTYETIVIDGSLHSDPFTAIEPHLDESICVGFSVLTGKPILDCLNLSKRIKQKNGIPVIWGGWHPSLFPEQILQDEQSVDVCVTAQGEHTFNKILDSLLNKKSLKEIEGITYRDGNKIIHNKAKPLKQHFPLLASDYEKLEMDLYFRKKGVRQIDYSSSQGCPYRCSFCADPDVYRRNYASTDGTLLAEIITELHEKFNFTDLNFQDESFFTQQERTLTFVEKITTGRKDFTWAATMRADHGSKICTSDWKKLKDSGLRRILIGVESANSSIIERLQKDITHEQVMYVAEKCASLKINATFSFMCGFPGEEKSHIQENIKLIKHLRKMSPGFETPMFFYLPYPSSLSDKGNSKKTTKEWGRMSFHGSRDHDELVSYFEKLEFYLKLAHTENKKLLWPLKKIAFYRCKYDIYGIPIEKILYNWICKSLA